MIIHYWNSIILFDRWWERDEVNIKKMLGEPERIEEAANV